MQFPIKTILKIQCLILFSVLNTYDLFGQVDSILIKALEIEDDSTRITEISEMINLHKRTDIEKAWTLAHILDSLNQLTNDPRWNALTRYQFGNLYYQENNYQIAIQQLTEAANLYQIHDPNNGQLAGVYNTIAAIYGQRENHEKAIEYYQQALETFVQKKDSLSIGVTLLNNSVPYIQLKKYDNAEMLLLKADSIFSVPSRQIYRGYSCLNLADTYQEQKRYKEANQYAKLAMKYMPMEIDPIVHSGGHLILGRTFLFEKNYRMAINELNKGLGIAQEIKYANHILDATEGLWQAHEASGQLNSAFPYIKDYATLKDSLRKEDEDKRMLDVLKKFEFEKQDAEFNQLQLEDELNQQKLSQQKWTIAGLGAGLGFLGLLLFGFFRQNKKIQKQNSIIATALSEKDTLLREIHHRVKNNLQVISSLLGIQGRNIKDQKIKDAIQEGRNRVQSMSLIHQNLYKKENLTGIEMADYIKKLGNSINASYNLQTEQVEIRYDVDDITLDVESVVPIGLITNELLTNSIKYAFPDNRKGIIHIRLKNKEDHLLLSISDNGIGLNPDQLQIKEDSFGHSLIKAFRNKLDATIDINGDNGTEVIIKIKNYSMIKT
jgi:two-component sensor histidine kinase